MKTLISKTELQKRVSELGNELEKYYEGKDLTVIAVQNGAMIFCADLVREIGMDIFVDSIMVSSYNHLSSSGEINFRCGAKLPVKNRHVLIVDDIFDTGLTAFKIMKHFEKEGALSVECCCLLNKKDVEKKAPPPKWIGFDIPEVFVVGYGLDADEKYRNLPEIRELPG